MKTTIPDGARAPTMPEACVSLLSLVVGISVSIAVYGLDPHIPMLLGVIVASLVALRCGFSWQTIQKGMVAGISNALPAVIILIVVGVLIGIWIEAGVVPTLISYGLRILSPQVFLPACIAICALTSLATGTSWGTTGTIGVALIGVGSGLGLPLPLVAGAVISGAYFGDKMSPLSDTTNLAAAMAGAELFDHIKHMAYTTGVAIMLTLVIDTVLGFVYAPSGPGESERVATMLDTMDGAYAINPFLLIPPILVLAVSYKRIPAIPGITIGALAGALAAILVQGSDYETLVRVAFEGAVSETGVEDVDSLLTRGGMNAMFYTISLVIVAMMFGGVMERTGQLRAIAARILSAAESTGSLVLATVLTSIASNLILCDQYMSIVMGARTYSEAYRDRDLAPENLSRAVEDSATVTAPLVPWNSGGAYQAATLGVATLAYAPFAFFCWISPIVTVVYGLTGWTIKKRDGEADDVETAEAEPAE